MESLMVLMALVALTSGQTCFDSAKPMLECIQQTVNETVHQSFEQLKGLKEKIEADCFSMDGVKGICTFPTPPPRPTGPPSFPTPPPEMMQCLNEARTTFMTCVQDAKIVLPQGMGDHKDMDHPPPPPPGGPDHCEIPHDKEGIKEKLNEFCGKNKTAYGKALECVLKTIDPYMTALSVVANPLAAVCNANATCSNAHPINKTCADELEKERKDLCHCQEKAEAVMHSKKCLPPPPHPHDGSTPSPMEHVKHAMEQVGKDFGHPKPPNKGFSICTNFKEECAKLEKKAGKNEHFTPRPRSTNTPAASG